MPNSCKTCTKCNTTKTITEFHKGKRTRCKVCSKEDQKRWSRPKQYISVNVKHCGRCNTDKVPSAFYKNARHKDRLSTYCKDCTKALRPNYTRDDYRNFHYKSEFGITLGDYELLFRQQNGRCAICLTSDPGTTAHFAVDHCHVTGRVRGLLCQKCNRGLGHYDDDPARLLAAAAYLRKHHGE